MRRIIAAVLAFLALPIAGQVTPAANYTDLWYLPAESGWGLSFTQHAGSNQVFAIWYTYDPRRPDAANPGRSKPLWIVMPGGTWTSPTTLQGAAYVTNGQPLGAKASGTRVGMFSFSFTGTSNGTFTYDIAPPAGLAPADPAYGLPSFSGSKGITRQGF